MLLWFNWFSRVERDTKCCKQEVAFSLQETSLWWHNNFITTSLQCCCRMTQLSVSLSIQFHPSRFLSLLQHFSGKKYISDVRTHNQNSKFFLQKKKCNPLLNEAQMEKSVFERTVKNLSAEESYRSRFIYLIRSNQRANEMWTKTM